MHISWCVKVVLVTSKSLKLQLRLLWFESHTTVPSFVLNGIHFTELNTQWVAKTTWRSIRTNANWLSFQFQCWYMVLFPQSSDWLHWRFLFLEFFQSISIGFSNNWCPLLQGFNECFLCSVYHFSSICCVSALFSPFVLFFQLIAIPCCTGLH